MRRKSELSRPWSPRKKAPISQVVRDMWAIVMPKPQRWSKYVIVPVRPARHIATAQKKRTAQIIGETRMKLRQEAMEKRNGT